MGITEMAPTLFTCTIQNCTMTFNSPRELRSHKEDFHGELGHSLPDSSRCSGASSSAQVKLSAVQQQTENGFSNASNPNTEAQNATSAQHQQKGVVTEPAGPKQPLNNISAPNSNLQPQTTPTAPADQVTATQNPQNRQESSAEPPRTFEYSPLPEDCIPRTFERTQFGGKPGTPFVRRRY